MPETLSESAETTLRKSTLVNAPPTGLKPAYDASWALVIGVEALTGGEGDGQLLPLRRPHLRLLGDGEQPTPGR